MKRGKKPEYNSIQNSTGQNWAKMNVFQKGKKTLFEMHEMAKNKAKKFERVVASAGPNVLGDSLSDFEYDEDMMRVEHINVRRGHYKNNSAEFPQSIDQVRHSV